MTRRITAPLLLALMTLVQCFASDGVVDFHSNSSLKGGGPFWTIARVTSVGDGQFTFQTHWWPNRIAHLVPATRVTCSKELFDPAGLKTGDLVEISGRKFDSVNIVPARVKVRRPRTACENSAVNTRPAENTVGESRTDNGKDHFFDQSLSGARIATEPATKSEF